MVGFNRRFGFKRGLLKAIVGIVPAGLNIGNVGFPPWVQIRFVSSASLVSGEVMLTQWFVM